jgi:hypothetical protein
MNDYAAVAEALREAANRVATLVDQEAAWPELWVQLNIQPMEDDTETAVATVDAVAGALLGHHGETHRLYDGAWHHDARGHLGPVRISVFCAVLSPDEQAAREAREELARLQAETEAARGELGGAS